MVLELEAIGCAPTSLSIIWRLEIPGAFAVPGEATQSVGLERVNSTAIPISAVCLACRLISARIGAARVRTAEYASRGRAPFAAAFEHTNGTSLGRHGRASATCVRPHHYRCRATLLQSRRRQSATEHSDFHDVHERRRDTSAESAYVEFFMHLPVARYYARRTQRLPGRALNRASSMRRFDTAPVGFCWRRCSPIERGGGWLEGTLCAAATAAGVGLMFGPKWECRT